VFSVFAKQKGVWKFHAFLSTVDQIKFESTHLTDIGMQSKIIPMDSFDIAKIKETEEMLNNS
jgi:hypothetical protein